MGTRAECRKFTANMFNKSKCSHCFRQREEHSAAALECNRSTRKVSRCGYLFVAPDWDFSNPLYRTKRWQRRWFVLYDDGELTYSVDEHPDTVPQAIVDMTKVLEVTTAEDVTSHPNSIAITAPDRVTFVKGTCPEEAKWWLNILAAFPKQKGRHKRNATFPGGQTTTIIQSQTMPVGRNRHNSYHKDTLQSPVSNIESISQSWNNSTNLSSNENNINANNENNNSNNTRVYSDQPVSSQSPPTRDKLHPEGKAQTRNRNRNRSSTQDTTDSGSPCLLIEDVIRDEKLKDIVNTLTNLSQHSSNRWSSSTCSPEKPSEEKPTRDENTIPAHNTIQMRPKSLPISPNAPSIVSAIVKKIPSTAETQRNSSLKQIQQQHQQKQLLQHQQQQQQQQQQQIQQQQQLLQPSSPSQQHERGDPDGGCVVDEPVSYSAKNSELRVNLPSEDLLHSKKGWLMKQDPRSGDWTKHWFTLRGDALFYYRDPVAENRGVLDGVLDVNSITGISEVPVPRNFGFQLATWDNRRIILSTVTASIRNNWINVLKSAAGLPMTKVTTPSQTENLTIDNNNHPAVEISEKQQTINTNNEIIMSPPPDEIKTKRTPGREFVKAQKNQENIYKSKILSNSTALTSVTSSPTALKPLQLSSDEEYRTASEGGCRRDSVDWGSPNSPSPPIPMSLARTKDKIRSRSNSRSRLHKRSRSSPPTSRRSTIDSVVSDDFPNINTVQEEVFLDKELQLRLQAAEKELTLLRDETHEREARMSELLATMERTEIELTARRREAEEAKDNLSMQLTESRSNAQEIIERLTIELDRTREMNKDLEDRLSRGIEENESLYKRLRELTAGSETTNLSRNKMKRMDSLSDLTKLNDINPSHLDKEGLIEEYNDLKARFERVVTELKAMKRELKESHKAFDNLEIAHETLQREYERKKVEDAAQSKMMAARIQDLTAKYTNAEKQVRTLKQKLVRADKRRTLSLKGKESMTIQKELEDKVVELEAKIESWESVNPDTAPSSPRASPPRSDSSEERSAKKNRLRRKSLESPTNQPMQILCRLTALEKKIDKNSNPATSELTKTDKYADHLVERLKNLETVVLTSRTIVEQSLQQFQSLKSSRSRRSVSPMPDKKDSFRFVERCLGEVSKILRDSCDSADDVTGSSLALSETSPIKLALAQLEAQLRNKLSDLLKQRRMLRETDSLTQQKDLELLAERIAFESVCFGKLRNALSRSSNAEDFGEKQTQSEIAETAQLMTILKSKLNGKCSIKPSGNTDILASVLARRLILTAGRAGQLKLPAHAEINSQIMEDLMRQQNELNMIANRYKTNAIENLAYGLAAETLSYISSNDAVQGTVQEAWRQAQEQVNAELIQSEISHIMMKNSQRLEHSMTPAFGYTLTAQERVSFENFSDAVQDALRKEMESAINQLTQCYEETLAKMKRGQWRLHMDQERKPSEGRQLLAEFADIVAHKALVDARISVLKGDYKAKDFSASKDRHNTSVTTLQKYENLFAELATDFGVESPDDILAEADFNFMYKYFSTELMANRSDIKEISSVLSKLEETVLQLQTTMNPDCNDNLEHFEDDALHGVCNRTNELQTRVEAMVANARSLVNRCADYDRLQDAVIQVTNQHEIDMSDMKQNYEESLHNLSLQIHEHKQLQRSLENEKNEVLEQANNFRNKLRMREKDLNQATAKLVEYENMCHDKDKENQELMDTVDAESEKANLYRSKYDEVLEKFTKLTEELMDLEKERDYIFEQMEKEQERCKSFEQHLEMLGAEHAQQIDNLHAAYREQQISGELMDAERDQNADESTRGRYQEEIEQLRTLCEKGLAAMESSHKKIILELEAKHEDEIQKLMCEKEQALAEETQATLAALDAMRKAHQNEVQREIARFKQEFVKQFQKSGQPSSYKERDQELEEVRQEILSLSEKYSIKCVEAASLDEKYRIAQQQLKISQQHIQQLDSRNKTLRAYLAKDDSKFGSNSSSTKHVDEIASTTTISSHESPNDIQLLNSKKDKHPRLKCHEGSKMNVTAAYQPSTKIDINCRNNDSKAITNKTFNLNFIHYNRNLSSDDNNNTNGKFETTKQSIDDGKDMKIKRNSIHLLPSLDNNVCSPPPPSGRDAEHQQMHRFELEI